MCYTSLVLHWRSTAFDLAESYAHITTTAVDRALARQRQCVLRTTFASQWKSGKFNLRNPNTPELMVPKICMRDYVADLIYPTQNFITKRLPLFAPKYANVH